MKFGFRPTQDPILFREALAEAEMAEACGFDSLWVAEHHGPSNSYNPAPLLTLAAFASRTQKVGLGTCVLLLPLHEPTKIAEQGALLDVISQGRLILGLGLGDRQKDFNGFGIPLSERGARMDEAIDLLRRLWNGERVQHQGRHFKVDSFVLGPKPVRPGGPRIWIGARAPKAIRRVARVGDALLYMIMPPLEELIEEKRLYEEDLKSLGKSPAGMEVPVVREVYLADSQKEAEERARQLIVPLYEKIYWPWNLASPVDPRTGLHPAWMVGDPETLVETIKTYQEELGMSYLICRMHYPGMTQEEVERGIRLFSQEIIPQFRQGNRSG